jgi:hypothetical protein
VRGGVIQSPGFGVLKRHHFDAQATPKGDRRIRRQKFRCWGCGTLLNPRFYDLHHISGYDALGYEEASKLVAVHRRCHEVLELDRRDGCHCPAA